MKTLGTVIIGILVSISSLAQTQKYVPSKQDTLLAEYASSASTKQGDLCVLAPGPKVTRQLLMENDLSKELTAMMDKIDFILVSSEELKLAFSKQTNAKIHLAEKSLAEHIGEPLNANWLIIRANGSKLGRISASDSLEEIVKHLSENGRPQE